MDVIAVLVAVLTSSVPDMLEKLFGVFKAYLELKRSREERGSLTEARRTNRTSAPKGMMDV